jgi:hypothetical protein
VPFGTFFLSKERRLVGKGALKSLMDSDVAKVLLDVLIRILVRRQQIHLIRILVRRQQIHQMITMLILEYSFKPLNLV